MITILRFTANWCAPCRMLAPVLQQLQEEYSDVKFEVVNVDEAPETIELYNIRSVPTVVLLKDGVVVHTIIGANPKKVYVDALEECKNINTAHI